MSRRLPSLILAPPAVFGVAVLALAAALAAPLRMPPPLASIHAGVLNIDQADKPSLSRFQARDGTWLAYRLYPAEDGATDRLAIIAHGSSALSDEMNVVARALAKNGIAAVAIDERGHGASGTRGDIAYIGQLDDDLADLIAELRETYATARLDFIGHSSGGGYGLRIAGGPLAKEFDRFILLAPYLGYFAPTNRPSEGAGRWAEPDIPRIYALKILAGLGIDSLQTLPVIGFANAPEAGRFVTSQYSYRLLMNYGPPTDWKGAFQASAGRIQVIAGENDELMDAPAYKTAIEPLGAKVTLLPDVDHMGVVYRPAALAAIVAAAKGSPVPERRPLDSAPEKS